MVVSVCIAVMPTKHCQKYFVIVLSKLGTINACLYAHQSLPLVFSSDTKTIIPPFFTVCMIPLTYLLPCLEAEHQLPRHSGHKWVLCSNHSKWNRSVFYVDIPMDPFYQQHKTGILNNMKGGGQKTILNLHCNEHYYSELPRKKSLAFVVHPQWHFYASACPLPCCLWLINRWPMPVDIFWNWESIMLICVIYLYSNKLHSIDIFYKQHIKIFVLSKTLKTSPTCFGHYLTIIRETLYLS